MREKKTPLKKFFLTKLFFLFVGWGGTLGFQFVSVGRRSPDIEMLKVWMSSWLMARETGGEDDLEPVPKY